LVFGSDNGQVYASETDACSTEYVIPVKDSTSVTLWEQTDDVFTHTFSTATLLAAGASFSTTAGESYRVTVVDNGNYLRIACSRPKIYGAFVSEIMSSPFGSTVSKSPAGGFGPIRLSIMISASAASPRQQRMRLGLLDKPDPTMAD